MTKMIKTQRGGVQHRKRQTEIVLGIDIRFGLEIEIHVMTSGEVMQ